MVVIIENQSDLNQAHSALFAHGAPAGGWILLNYSDPDRIRMANAGGDGLEHLPRNFRDNEIQYALIRIDVPAGDGKQEPRDVFVTWTGPGVGFMEEGKKLYHRDVLAGELPSHHASVRADDVKRFNLENLRAAVNKTDGEATV